MLNNLLSDLYNSGVRIVLENEKLLVRSTRGKIPNELLQKIKKYKPELINYLQSKTYKVEFNKINKAVSKAYYALSSAQKRLYLLQEMEPDSTAYNMPYIISLGAEAEKEKIEEAFYQFISRHESFRTSFEIIKEEPVQRIHEQVDFKLEEFTVEKVEEQNIRNKFIQPFDLSQAPLLRVAIVNIKGEGSLLMIDMHHIIGDGVSHSILEREFKRLYSGEELVPLNLQYKDYSEWQNSEEQKVKVKKQEEYWKSIFEGEIPVLNLPTDYVRPVIQSHEGASVGFALSKEETKNIKTLEKENGLTLYMSVLSVFSILLSKLSGLEDIVVGMPIVGRNHSDLENIVGVFVNTLAIRNEVNGNTTLKEFVEKLKYNTLEAFENQDYQFEDLVEKISLERDISRNPIFDVMFNLLNKEENSSDLTGLDNHNFIHTSGISKFDLTLTAADYDDQLILSFEYCTQLFKAETIDRFIAYFKKIVSQLVRKPEIKISAIDILTEKEKNQLLYEFNNSETEYPKDKTIHQLFEEQVEKYPDRILVSKDDTCISYDEINIRSNQLARQLKEAGIRVGNVVGLVAARSEKLLISILGILKCGAAYLPLNPSWPKERMKFMMSDSCCSTLIHGETYNLDPDLKCQFLDINNIDINKGTGENLEVEMSSSNILYIIYTSGTTGIPKGVLTTHSNVSRVVLNTNYLSIKKCDRILQLSSYTFDGSVFDIYGALLNGSRLVMLNKEDLLNIDQLLGLISKQQISIFFITTALFNTLVDYGPSKLKDVRKILFGGERISVQHTQKALEKLGEGRLVHVYGPTETTVFASFYNINNIDEARETIPIGKPISNTTIYLLDKAQKNVPNGVSGEIYIGSKGNALGYLNNVELTLEKFIDHPYKKGEKLYQTGDLAYRLPNGNIEFLGRIDHQVKIRGFRIELGEIESALLKYENIKESVVLDREENGDKYLCAYLVTEEGFKEEDIRTYLSANLPDYMIPSYFVQMENLPLTTNGKVNRKALPLPEIKADDNYIAPSNAMEEKLVEIWSEVLNIEKDDISTIANFFTIGGHSLKASVLIGRIHKEIGVEFPLRDVFLHSSIQAQASQIEISTKKDFVSIPKAKDQVYYSLSSAQKRLYLLQEMELESTVYNMPYIIPIGAKAEKQKIEEVFRQLISRHESFRTSFTIEGEEPVQCIHEKVEFTIEEFNIEKDEVQNKKHQFIQAFDLSQAPLLRVAKVNINDGSSLLMIDMHHIISDGVSQAILEHDFQRLYSGEKLAPLSLQYKDYSEWQNSEEQQIKVKKQEDYWIKKFEEEIPVLNLPIEKVRPAIQSHEGANVSFALSKEETQNIKSLAKENDLTLYMSVLSAFNILLSKLSGQEDIIVGTPIAGRNHRELENIVGVFVNTLAIRNNVNAGLTLRDYLQEIKKATLGAYDNQDYPFEDLVEKVSIERNISRNPLFDVMCNLLNQTEYSGDLSDFSNDHYVHSSGISKFDLSLSVVDYGEQLLLSFEYCTKLFSAETIDRFINYFKQLLNQLPEKLAEKLSILEIIPESEKQQILYDFNDSEKDYPRDKRIHQLFEEQVSKTPNNIALVFGTKSITYSELNKKSNQLARYLKGKGLDVNDKVSLMLDRSSDVVLGILGILKAGGVYLPIDSAYPESRLNYIISNSDSKIILTQNALVDKIEGKLPIVVLDDLDLNKEEALNLNTKIASNNLSYIIYTSGSTGNPKGVQVEHSSVVNLLYFLQETYPLNENDSYLLKTSYCFDVSVSELFGWILGGGKLSILEKDHEKESSKIIEAIDNYQITHINFVPTVFKLFSDSIYSSDKNKLISLKYILIAGEALLKEHLHEFNNLNLKAQIANLYGPTEATVYTSHYELSSDEFGAIFIGKPISNYEIYIVDSNNQIQPIGVSGELLVGGEGLARGYLSNEELTTEKFIENPLKEGERLYRTGDLARWLPDGNIEFLGRIDHQVKIRGFRIELGEVDSILHKHENIKESVVLVREENGEKYLCAYLVTEEDINEEEIRSYLSASLPDYMIPSYFVQLEKLPLTSNGKVNRKVLPSPEIKAGKDYVAPSNATEEKLVEIWSEILKIEKEEISVTANFFSIGGHSLKATVLTGRIHKEIGVEFPLRDVFVYSTIKAQAGQIKTSSKKDFVTIPKAKDQDYYTLSSAQKRLYLLQEMELDSTAYNMPYTIPLGAEVDKNKIEEAFHQLIKRHESFRTSFEIINEEPVQLIHEQVKFKLEEFNIEKEEVKEQQRQFIQAFDLSLVPLLRAAILNIKGEGSLLIIDMHHIISDGVSHSILEREFQRLYSGEELVPLSLQYKDYSEWQNSEEQKIKVKEQEEYWIRKFEEEIPVLNLPTDYVRPVMQSAEGATVSFALSKEETQNIKLLAKENRLTLYMSVLSVFSILLSKLSGQEDIVIGMPIAGRNHSDLENIVGVFVNTLALRNEVNGNTTLKEFVEKLKQNTLETFENQDYQFEDLVEKISIKRDISRNPLFDVMFDLINLEESTRDLKGDISTEFIHTVGISKFDLTMTAIDYGEQLLISIEYCTKLFKASTIDRYKKYLKELINQISLNPERELSELEIISAEEKQQLLYEFNDTQKDYSRDKTIHEIFEEQVERTPNKIAIIKGNECLTYRELNRKANQLAWYCRSKGVVKESKIGLLTDHSLGMMIGMLGILKSGGCYVPIDISYPKERINFIIEDAEIDIILLSDINLSSTIQVGIHIDLENSYIYNTPEANLEHINKPSDLSYIIYTSGSTGKPKGVMVEHRNVVSYIYAFQNEFCLNSNDNVMQQASISFDTFVEEAYPVLTIGGKLTIIEKEEILDLDKLGRLIKNKNITVISCSPLLLNEINTFPFNLLSDVRLFISGGDELRQSFINNLIDFSNVYNTYGPTEATVCSLYYKCEKDDIEKIPVGNPVANDSVFILDENLKLLPIGVAGELCIGGAGLSRGYLNNEKLTSERFIEHPFKEGERLYKTGDLARWLPDGNVEFLGRIDHQVKIRGFRIELGEIENILQKHKSIKESIVLAIEEKGGKYLCAYLVTEKNFNQEEIRTFLSASLPNYMIPSYFVELDRLPLTANGKVNRKALPSPEIKAGDDYLAPSNETEEKLVKIWSEVLNIEKEEISVTANFFAIGGHSLKASVLTGRIHKEIGVEFPLRDVFLHSTIKAQASQIGISTKKDFVSITKAKEQKYYTLSSAQKRLYLLQQMDLGSTAYNMPYVIPLGAEVDKYKIEEAFQQLIKRHESFRTSFAIAGEEPVQRIHEQVEFKLEEFTITKEELQNQRQQFIQAFDLSKVPLLRVSKVDIKGEGSLLMIDMHHIISDGVSHTILEQDFQRLYAGEELAPLSLQYKDYSEWQNSEEQQIKVKDQENYWINKFEGEIPVLNLPIDKVRPAIQSHEGASVSFILNKEETKQIKSLAKENDLTLYMSILTAFNILLSKLSGQEDIIVGTPIAGRNHPDLDNLVGVFINTLAIRNEVNGDNTLKEFIKKLKQSTLEAFENQDYQFEELIENISIERDISRNPLFNVMFNLLNHTDYSGDLTELGNDHYVHISGISKFDLSLSVVDYGNQLLCNLVYCTQLFKPESIERYIGYFKQIINQLPVKLDKQLSTLEFITEAEKRQLLYEFNDTQIDSASDKTIHQLFEEQVSKNPDNIALISGEEQLSYLELHRKSNQLAQYLRNKGVRSNTVISLYFDPSLEMLISILGVLKSGAIYLPINPEINNERVNYIIADSGSDIVLTHSLVDFESIPNINTINVENIIIKEDCDELMDMKWEYDSAYIIYTSGTTGKPKGVLLSHKNLMNYFTWFNSLSKLENNDRTVLVTSYSFDLGYTGLYSSIINGGQLHLVSKNLYLSPNIFNDYLIKNRISYLKLTSSLYTLLIDNVNFEKALKNLRLLVLGGEEINVDAVKYSLALKEGIQIINHYGPTEATIGCISYEINKDNINDYKIKPVIGKPIDNTSAYVLNEYNQVQLYGISGELTVSGDGLAQGYINNPELTAEKFVPNPFKLNERLYHTGDLASRLSDGTIEFLGRIDNQVKIRGFRIELGEIENVLQKHARVKESLVIVREENGDKYLCAYLVTEQDFNQEEIRTYLTVRLPDYMIPSYIVELESLPLNANGKVNRKALPSPEIKAGDNYVGPLNEIEEKLVEIWSQVLKIEKEEISTTANFFSIGGHSLKASVLTGRIHKEIGVEFPLRDVFLHSSIQAQAGQIKTRDKKDFVSIPKAKDQEYYPLSSAQKRLYLLQEMELDSTVYNMPYTIPLGKEAEKEKIEEVFRQLIKRHESFRTSFDIEGEEPVQRIHEQVEFKLEELTITKEEVPEKRQQFIQAFDLSKAPLLRVSKFDVKGEGSLLMIDMHHIISDGVSHAILEEDFQRLYSGEDLTPLSLQYKDYSQWQNSEEQQLKVKEQEDYWIKKFEEEIPVLNLPTDYVRPLIQSHEGARVSFALCKEETQNIKSLAKENDLTLYMSVLSAFYILLSKLSGQEDIIIGTPIAGRNHTDLENIVGVFVNTLAIRIEINENISLREFISELKHNTLEVYENQDYQFEDLVDKVSVERDISRNPLFDVMFNLLNHADYSGDLSDLDNNQYDHTPDISKFDLGLSAIDYGDQLLFNFAYCTQLFNPDTIERFIRYFKQIVNQITQKIDSKISEIEIISAEEKQQLLYEFNNTKTDYPKDKTIHQLFEEQVEKSSDRIALVFKEQLITYKELNIRSNQLAQLLLSKGLKPEDIVGILLDRSMEMIIGILGILKAGGTYLPLDIKSPKERIEYIIQESALRIILSQVSDYKEKEFKGELLNLFDSSLYLNNQDQNINQSKSSNAAYIIYTSGSTGKPKGVIVEHGNVVNLVNGLTKSIYNNYQETLHVSLISPLYFDASVKQIFPTITLGHSLNIIPETVRFEGAELVSHYTKHDIQIADGTPFHAQMLAQYIEDKTQGLNIRQFVIGGDELKLELMQSLFQKIDVKDLKISNVYGPTECTDVTTIKTSTIESLKEKGNTSIGKPISNYEIFILGKNLELLPIGVPGELCISGAGVSRGYLFNEKLSSEKFIKHPYKEKERLYKTGDLACWLPDGDIEFLGRIDHQVKIRGFRIELGEIENVLLKYKSIKESVVLAREENGEKYLCAYLITEKDFNQEEIRTHLSVSLPDYMIPSYFVQLKEFPLTSNGKVNRKALPLPEIKAGEDYVAPSNTTEEELVEIWSEVLKIEKEKISVMANFFNIGGHSLKAIVIANRIQKNYNVKIPLTQFFKSPFIRSLALFITINIKQVEDQVEYTEMEF